MSVYSIVCCNEEGGSSLQMHTQGKHQLACKAKNIKHKTKYSFSAYWLTKPFNSIAFRGPTFKDMGAYKIFIFKKAEYFT